jgi:hypothetical protein
MGFTINFRGITMQHVNDIDKYVDNKLIRFGFDQWNPNLAVACYTKACFFDRNSWDDVTKANRGTLFYREYQVNKPFDKIFNLGEVPETDVETVIERMKKEDFTVLDKVNGHLLILSIFPSEDGHQFVFSTKGSLPNDKNDLLNEDIRLFKEKHGKALKNIAYGVAIESATTDGTEMSGVTLMFESVVEHDKHTLWDKEVETYGANEFVLLGGTLTYHEDETFRVCDFAEYDPDQLEIIANVFGTKSVNIITEGTDRPIEDWFKDKNTEGYVIRFDNGDRVKVKTDE